MYVLDTTFNSLFLGGNLIFIAAFVEGKSVNICFLKFTIKSLVEFYRKFGMALNKLSIENVDLKDKRVFMR